MKSQKTMFQRPNLFHRFVPNKVVRNHILLVSRSLEKTNNTWLERHNKLHNFKETHNKDHLATCKAGSCCPTSSEKRTFCSLSDFDVDTLLFSISISLDRKEGEIKRGNIFVRY